MRKWEILDKVGVLLSLALIAYGGYLYGGIVLGLAFPLAFFAGCGLTRYTASRRSSRNPPS